MYKCHGGDHSKWSNFFYVERLEPWKRIWFCIFFGVNLPGRSKGVLCFTCRSWKMVKPRVTRICRRSEAGDVQRFQNRATPCKCHHLLLISNKTRYSTYARLSSRTNINNKQIVMKLTWFLFLHFVCTSRCVLIWYEILTKIYFLNNFDTCVHTVLCAF